MCWVLALALVHCSQRPCWPSLQTGFAFFFPFDPMGMRNQDKELKELKVGSKHLLGGQGQYSCAILFSALCIELYCFEHASSQPEGTSS